MQCGLTWMGVIMCGVWRAGVCVAMAECMCSYSAAGCGVRCSVVRRVE